MTKLNLKPSILALSLAGFSSLSAWANDVDRIYFNAKIYTAVDQQGLQQAIAIGKDGNIVQVGSDQDIKKLADKNTQIIDLKQTMIMPGLIDSHIHALASGVEMQMASLNEESPVDIDFLVQAVKQAEKDGTGVVGDVLVLNGLAAEYWAKTAELDKTFNQGEWKNKPVALVGSDHHTAWVNKAMLDKAGLNAAYVKKLSKIERTYITHDKKLQPTGFLLDEGWDVVSQKIPKMSDEQLLKGSKEAIHYYNSLGLTAWMDIGANTGPVQGFFNIENTPETLGMIPIYKQLSQQGALSAHVSGLHIVNSKSGPEVLETLEKINAQYQGINNFNLIGIKVFADGVPEYPAQSAALLGKYSNSNKSGHLLFEPKKFQQLVNAADQKGMLVHIHTIGDKAVKESLNAIEYARQQRDSHIPHSLTHVQFVDPQDYPRFKQNNVIASMQMAWAYEDGANKEMIKPYVSESLYKGMYPTQSLYKNGAIIAGASDFGVSTPNPFVAMATGISRKGIDGGYLNPEQVLDRDTVFKAYTINSAKALRLDKTIGSLEAGKKADMIAVDRDIFKVSPVELGESKVLWTMFEGKIVYQQ